MVILNYTLANIYTPTCIISEQYRLSVADNPSGTFIIQLPLV